VEFHYAANGILNAYVQWVSAHSGIVAVNGYLFNNSTGKLASTGQAYPYITRIEEKAHDSQEGSQEGTNQEGSQEGTDQESTG